MSPAPLPAITALYAGLLGLLLFALALRISIFRRGLVVGLGDGGNPALTRAIRAHGNAVEWAVPVLLLLLVAELNRASPLLLHACGAALVLARLLHAFGLSSHAGYSAGRFSGIMLTWLVLLVLAAWDIFAFVRTLLV